MHRAKLFSEDEQPLTRMSDYWSGTSLQARMEHIAPSLT